MVNVTELVLLPSATEVAVTVAVHAVLSEASDGGVKVAVVFEVEVMVPQPVWGVTLQWTPPLLGSLETVDASVTDGSPALTLVDDAPPVNDVLTEMADLLLPQPLSSKNNSERNTKRHTCRMLLFIQANPHWA
jgi:hypothetical protein